MLMRSAPICNINYKSDNPILSQKFLPQNMSRVSTYDFNNPKSLQIVNGRDKFEAVAQYKPLYNPTKRSFLGTPRQLKLLCKFV